MIRMRRQYNTTPESKLIKLNEDVKLLKSLEVERSKKEAIQDERRNVEAVNTKRGTV